MDSRIFPHVKCSRAENPNGRLAGIAGFEPANLGVKVPCLRPLGDTPVCRLMQRRPAEPTCNLDQSRPRSSKRHFRLKHDLMIPSEWGVPISLVYSQTSLSAISTRRHRCQMRRFHSIGGSHPMAGMVRSALSASFKRRFLYIGRSS